MNDTPPLLEVTRVSVNFGAIRALDDVSLLVAPGEVIGLIGPNGAGKSTLINAIAGVFRSAPGTVRFGGVDLSRKAVHVRARLGIARTFQNLALFPAMTVLENVLTHLDVDPALAWYREWWPAEAARAAEKRERAMDALEGVGLAPAASRPVDELSYPERKLVEFARATVGGARLILLDEPTAGLAMEDRHRTVDRMRRLIGDRALTAIIVEHDMGVIRGMSSHVHVMDAGSVIASGPFIDVIADDRVRQAYLG